MARAFGHTSGRCRPDPKSCLIALSIELHEHTVAYAARVLRERGATPTQVKVGIHLALGKDETGDCGRTRPSTLLGRGSCQKALSNSRCSQFHRARHENLAEPKKQKARSKFAACGMSYSGAVLRRRILRKKRRRRRDGTVFMRKADATAAGPRLKRPVAMAQLNPRERLKPLVNL